MGGFLKAEICGTLGSIITVRISDDRKFDQYLDCYFFLWELRKLKL